MYIKMWRSLLKLDLSTKISESHITLTILIFVTTSLIPFLVVNCNSEVISSSLRKELMLTHQEKTVLDQLKSEVHQNLTLDFLRESDLFLLRWIRSKNLNLERSKRDLLALLGFLEKNKIIEDDFSDIRPDMPFSANYTDKHGRPVGYLSFDGDNWNIRRGILRGKRERGIRYMYKLALELNDRIWDIGKKPHSGQYDFKCMLILNLIGYNLMQHSCAQCISIYLTLLNAYEQYFPGHLKEVIIINVPQSYQVLLEIARPVLSKETRDALHVFGTNRKIWKPYLEARMDISQFPDLD